VFNWNFRVIAYDEKQCLGSLSPFLVFYVEAGLPSRRLLASLAPHAPPSITGLYVNETITSYLLMIYILLHEFGIGEESGRS
jgi:hypothetical protein